MQTIVRAADKRSGVQIQMGKDPNPRSKSKIQSPDVLFVHPPDAQHPPLFTMNRTEKADKGGRPYYVMREYNVSEQTRNVTMCKWPQIH